MRPNRKDRLISDALDTPEGREALAAAMVAPFRCGGLEYCQHCKEPVYSHQWIKLYFSFENKCCPYCERINK
jgi:hypothetical protein